MGNRGIYDAYVSYELEETTHTLLQISSFVYKAEQVLSGSDIREFVLAFFTTFAASTKHFEITMKCLPNTTRMSER